MLRVEILRDRGIDFAVGDIRSEATTLDVDGQLGSGVYAEFCDDRAGTTTPLTSGLLEDLHSLCQCHRRQLVVIRQAAAFGSHPHIGTIATVLGGDHFILFRVQAQVPGKAQQQQRLVEADGIHRHGRPQAGHLRLAALLDVAFRRQLRLAELHIGTKATGLDGDRLARVGIEAQLAVPHGGPLQQLQRAFDGQFVRGDLVWHRRPQVLVADLHVRPVATDATDHLLSRLVVPEGDSADRPRIDLVGVGPDEILQADLGEPVPFAARLLAEVEIVQPRNRVGLAARDGVETILHAGGETEIHQVREVLFQQIDHGEGGEGRHQSGTLRTHVAPVLDRLDDGGIRGRASNAALLKFTNEAGFGVPPLGLGEVLLRFDPFCAHGLALVHGWQDFLLIVQGGGRIVAALHIGPQKAREGDDFARGGEHSLTARAGGGTDAHVGAHAVGVLHLRGDGTGPDQLVQAQLVGVQFVAHLPGGAKGLTGGANRFVRLLGILRTTAVDPWLVRQILGAVQLGHLRPGRMQGL